MIDRGRDKSKRGGPYVVVAWWAQGQEPREFFILFFTSSAEKVSIGYGKSWINPSVLCDVSYGTTGYFES